MFLFAFKNMLRYKNRAVVTLLVVVLTSITSMIAVAFLNGVFDLMISGFVKYQTGHIRIASKEYVENIRFRPIYENISNISQLVTRLKKDSKIERVVPTIQFHGFVTLGGGEANSLQSRVIALPFDNNAHGFKPKMKEGSPQSGGIWVGRKFANKMNISLNEPIMVFTLTSESGLNAVKTNLSGIYQYNIKNLDSQTIFMDLPLAQRLLKIADAATEIYIHLKDERKINEVAAQLRQDYPDYAVQTYLEQLGSMGPMIVLQKRIMILFMMVVVVLGSLAVVNSLIASIYDRINEIGMMKALGFTHKELTIMLVSEGAIYGIVGTTLGMMLGYLIMIPALTNGIDLTAIVGSSDLPADPIMYPQLLPMDILMLYILGIIIPTLLAILPSRHIKKITPVEALRS
ncbi:MAG: ABC transporter permease [Brevinema sp.]